jgi:hypothetical protein
MAHFNSGVAGITNNSKGLFNYSISTIEMLMKKEQTKGSTVFTSYDAKRPVPIFGKQLEDITALLRLQKQMVEYSSAFYRLVIPEHYQQAC